MTTLVNRRDQVEKAILQEGVRLFAACGYEGTSIANATRLLFAIRAMTQAYADFAAQMALVLDRAAPGADDFEAAETLITGMVLAAVGLDSH